MLGPCFNFHGIDRWHDQNKQMYKQDDSYDCGIKPLEMDHMRPLNIMMWIDSGWFPSLLFDSPY